MTIQASIPEAVGHMGRDVAEWMAALLIEIA
jgi:hypothetical protein